MKIVKIVGNAFINTVPASVGESVKPYDMLDTRQATVTFEDGTEIIGMCTRLVDLGLATVDEVIEQITDAVTTQEPLSETSPVIEPVSTASETPKTEVKE